MNRQPEDPVSIRGALPGDAPVLAELATQLGYPTDPRPMLERLGPILASDESAVLVAISSTGVIGWLHVAVVHSLESAPFALILGLVVGEAHRNRGIGARLVEAAESWARGRGLARIRVRSNTIRERAHRFYERLGYEFVKTQVALDKTFPGDSSHA